MASAAGPLFAIELKELEVRSEVGMPFIAHVQFELQAAEMTSPELAHVTVRSTSPADFKGILRTRLFLQPNSTSGFIRITAIEPASRGMTIVLEARDPRQNHIREYVIDNNQVRVRDLQRPELPPPKPQQAFQAPVPEPREEARTLEPAPPDGIELRLLDQTQSAEVVSPRALASDLELLSRTQAELSDDPDAKVLAGEALLTLGQLLQNARGLWDYKASREVVTAAMENEFKENVDSYVLTIRADQNTDIKTPQAEIATLGKPGDKAKPTTLPLEATLSQNEALSPLASQADTSGPVEHGVPIAQPPVREEPGVGIFAWFVLLSISLACGCLAWYLTWVRGRSQQAEVPSSSAPQMPLALEPLEVRMETAAAQPFGLSELQEEGSPSESHTQQPEPEERFPQDDQQAPAQEPASDWVQTLDEPDFEAEVAAAQAMLASPGPEDDIQLEEPQLPVEPPFKNENDARIELANAYLEIEDYDAALKVLASIEGDLTDGQREQLAQIRELIVQGEASQ
ncbi:hypothetical protein [Limnobacter sp.]|uniref:hypothetical protein n=1 Tax=Limnobacter sp. TaxID=2003368 RepID=UPI0035177E7F